MRTFALVTVLAAGVVSAEERQLSGHAVATTPAGHAYGLPPTPAGHVYGLPEQGSAHSHSHVDVTGAEAVPQQQHGIAAGSDAGHAYAVPVATGGASATATATASTADEGTKISTGSVVIWILFGLLIGALMIFPLCYYLARGGTSEAREAPIASPAAPDVEAPAPAAGEPAKEEPAAVAPAAAAPEVSAAAAAEPVLEETNVETNVEPTKMEEDMMSEISDQEKYGDVIAMSV